MFLTDDGDTKESIQKLFAEVDTNGDGSISKDEFIELLLNHKTPF